MYRTLSFLLLSLLTHSLLAQIQRIDSLKQEVLTYPKEDSAKVDLYNLIAFEIINTDPDEGRKYAGMGYELAQEIGYSNGYARGLNLVGSSFLTVGEYDAALDFYLKSLEVYERTGFQMGIFITYNNIGELYEKKHQLHEALRYHKKSLDLKEKYLKERHPIMSHVNLGEIYYRLNYLDSAATHFRMAEKMAKEENRPKAIAYAQTGIGKVYAKRRNYSPAFIYLNLADQIWTSLEDYVGMFRISLERAKISFESKNFDSSLVHVQSAIEKAEKVSAQDLKLEALELRYKIDSAKQDFESAFASMRAYDQLKGKIFDLAKEKQLQNIQAKFEFEEEERIHVELIKEKKLSEEIVSYQRTMIAGIGLILLLISVIAVLFYNQVKKQARLNRLLKEKNGEIKEKAMELEILNNNLEEMVEERTNVIQKKNVKLKEYSFLNAHIVRGPLANILGLTKLLKNEIEEEEKRQMIEHLHYSADKLDDVLTDIKKKLEKGELIN
ncbi:MAG: tetratricopeptide repeat protein [Reichenbachiella sp.]|uniref:tetratricopeptide repeat protein n=1 Tax=Reichenbachiella sp. TaxID=2184521 RepID=UPI0032665D87